LLFIINGKPVAVVTAFFPLIINNKNNNSDIRTYFDLVFASAFFSSKNKVKIGSDIAVIVLVIYYQWKKGCNDRYGYEGFYIRD
jgi:hypothetical protein